MGFAVENIRLKELAIVANQNKAFYDDFISYLNTAGYSSLFKFACEQDASKAGEILINYLKRDLPKGIQLLDGIARPYAPEKAKWLFLGWIFRDAPEQRLKPMVSSMEGSTRIEREAKILNIVRAYSATIFTTEDKWNWSVISEVIIDRLEGSRRAIKGNLFEAIVRRLLGELFKENGVLLKISETEIKLDEETYDVSVGLSPNLKTK